MEKSKRSILEEAVKNGTAAKLKHMITESDEELDDLVHVAVSCFRMDSLAALLDAGCSANSINDKFKRPIQVATEKGNLRAIPLLLEHGAKIEQVSEGGGTLVHHAAKFDSAKSVEYCLKMRPDLRESVNYSKETPLHIAAALDNFEVVLVLLKYKAIIEAKDSEGRTPIHKATGKSLKILLNHGADVNVTARSMTPLCEVVARGSLRDTKIMIGNSLKILDYNTPLKIAARKNRLDLFELLVKSGANLKDNFSTLVQIVVSNGYIELFKYILNCCDDPDIHLKKCMSSRDNPNEFTIAEYIKERDSPNRNKILNVIEKLEEINTNRREINANKREQMVNSEVQVKEEDRRKIMTDVVEVEFEEDEGEDTETESEKDNGESQSEMVKTSETSVEEVTSPKV